METMTNAVESEFSPRSQRSLIQEKTLRAKLVKCDSRIGYLEREIRDLEASKARTMECLVGKRDVSSTFLPDMLRELEDRNSEVAAFRVQRSQIQSEIKGLIPTPASAAERAERQSHVAKLAAERLRKDGVIDGALEKLRRLLEERAQLTAEMTEAAGAADLTFADDGMDNQFEMLLDSLPEDLAAASEDWFDWFTGKLEGLKSYVVVGEQVQLAESLARAGFYGFGDKVEMTDAMASELLRASRPRGIPGQGATWRYIPPQIVPLETFEALLREAADEGVSVQAVVARRNQELESKAKDEYGEEYRGLVRVPEGNDDQDIE